MIFPNEKFIHGFNYEEYYIKHVNHVPKLGKLLFAIISLINCFKFMYLYLRCQVLDISN